MVSKLENQILGAEGLLGVGEIGRVEGVEVRVSRSPMAEVIRENRWDAAGKPRPIGEVIPKTYG